MIAGSPSSGAVSPTPRNVGGHRTPLRFVWGAPGVSGGNYGQLLSSVRGLLVVMTSPTTTQRIPTASSQPNVRELAAAARPDRNRAIDLYRALAMIAVSIGHWAAIVLSVGPNGALITGNALEYSPSMSWVTWILQVMPLFFVVGGFASAISLDSHMAREGRPQDWVAARLRRMVAPAITLALTWLTVLAVASGLGYGSLMAAGATAAAIPLWFLSNYAIDTAIAPYVLPAFRRAPARVAALTLGLFGAIEIARFAEVPILPHINWVVGWLLFQMAGFAWRDGLLPTGRRMGALAAGLSVAAIVAVAFGPWPVAMVHFPGLANSPTHPPSLALLLFGSAYSAIAISVAPAVSAWLARHKAAWAAVVAANSMALSVYLWHFTAAVAAGALFFVMGWLPTAAVGSAMWWLQKLPLMAASTVILAGIVALVAKTERKALLAPRTPFAGGQVAMLASAAVLSVAVKAWAHGSIASSIAGMITLVAVWHGSLNRPARSEPAISVASVDTLTR